MNTAFNNILGLSTIPGLNIIPGLSTNTATTTEGFNKIMTDNTWLETKIKGKHSTP